MKEAIKESLLINFDAELNIEKLEIQLDKLQVENETLRSMLNI